MANKNSPSKIAASNRYRDRTYDTFSVSVKKGKKEILRSIATDNSTSLQGLVKIALEKYVFDQTGELIDL